MIDQGCRSNGLQSNKKSTYVYMSLGVPFKAFQNLVSPLFMSNMFVCLRKEVSVLNVSHLRRLHAKQ